MTPLRFAFVLHIHQPVGNFDFVFREHADDVYRPFLDFLEARELWPIGLHVSGPLIEWLGDNDAALHDRIGRLATDGRVELLSAGWYEPILAALEPDDRAVQLGWMREELERRFGVTPKGLWLTERVWVPELARDLAEAGIEYALVDDHLLRRAGVPVGEAGRPVVVEHEGRAIDLLAIDEALRYLIPFRPAEEVATDLERRHQEGDALALFADDGEKFGGWPRTREWLYDRGWLEAFGSEMDRLLADGTVRLVTTAQALAEIGRGRAVELPGGSYPEMDDWAGGPWTNFLDRYDEAGRLHTWMSELSAESRRRGDPPDVRRAIGQGQCNDAYWHGVFGGLYMRHLREGVRGCLTEAERLLAADTALGWCESHDRAGRRQHRVRSAGIVATVDPASGGTLSELVWLDPEADVTNYLTRRLEAYHQEAVARHAADAAAPDADTRASSHDPDQGTGEGVAAEPASGSASIHDVERVATLERLPPVDRDVRVLVRERVLSPDVDADEYREGSYTPTWTAPDVHLPEPEASPGALVWRSPKREGDPRKTLRIAEDRVEWCWQGLAGLAPEGSWFCPEISVSAAVDLTYDPPPAEVWSYPIVTVSKCPEGFEEIEQGSSLTPRWPISADQVRIVLRPVRPGAHEP